MSKLSLIQIVILLLSLIDITATYIYVSTFHSKFPNLDYTQLEANPILRFSWKTFGMGIGTLVGGIIVFSILFLIIYNAKINWQYYLFGVLSMMCIYHILNINQLAHLKPA
jgi:hypothetical protein